MSAQERVKYYLTGWWAVAATLTTVFVVLPQIETELSPVVTKVELSNFRVGEGGLGKSLIASGEAEKLRDCKWVETRWYLGSRDDPNAPLMRRFEHLEPPQIRGVGTLYWGGMKFPIESKEVVLNETHADVLHSCYRLLPFYKTRSKFYR